MNSMTRDYINDLVEKIMEVTNITAPINDIDELVRKLGGTVSLSLDLTKSSDGTIQKKKDNTFEIKVIPWQSELRKNFTIAHEIGHLFLHMGYGTDIWNNIDVDTVYGRNGTSEQEYQANEFAAALLMPKKVFKEKVAENTKEGMVDMGKVAEFFNVSVAAAINRGRFLGCIR